MFKMLRRNMRETKQQLCRTRSSHQLSISYCIVSLHLLCDDLRSVHQTPDGDLDVDDDFPFDLLDDPDDD